jgi:hypothetical protein
MTFAERFCAHLIAYGPIVLLAWRARRGVRVEGAWWLCALAFLVSAPADIASLMLRGEETWIPTHFYPLPQLGLFAWAALSSGLVFVWSTLGMVWATSLGITPLTEPEWGLTVGGGIVVAVAGWRSALRWPIAVYCGVASLLYLGMIRQWQDHGVFMPWWYAYQTARLGAFGLFARAAWRANA